MTGGRASDRAIGRELAEWGTVLLLETRGRSSGTPVSAAVGYVEQPDGGRSWSLPMTRPATGHAISLRPRPAA